MQHQVHVDARVDPEGVWREVGDERAGGHPQAPGAPQPVKGGRAEGIRRHHEVGAEPAKLTAQGSSEPPADQALGCAAEQWMVDQCVVEELIRPRHATDLELEGRPAHPAEPPAAKLDGVDPLDLAPRPHPLGGVLQHLGGSVVPVAHVRGHQ